MSLRAYQQTAARAETSRETEYRLFGQVTRALMEAAKLDPSDLRGRADALDWNRRMWSAFATDCGTSDRTGKAHLTAVFEKLNLTDRLQLALRVHGIH